MGISSPPLYISDSVLASLLAERRFAFRVDVHPMSKLVSVAASAYLTPNGRVVYGYGKAETFDEAYHQAMSDWYARASKLGIPTLP